MKKLLILTAASMTLAGCVKNEPAPDKSALPDAKISFEAPLMGKTTRAQPGEIGSNDAYPTNESFKVWGWYHTNKYTTFGDPENGWSNYMTDESGAPLTVSKDASGNFWAPKNDYYWPASGYLTFAAYSPADAQGTFVHTSKGLTISGFTVPEIDQQYDLMYSDRVYNCKASSMQSNVSPGNYSGIQITFRHALSSIRFKVGTKENCSGADLEINVTKIEVNSITNTGDFAETLTDGPSSTNRTPAWSKQTGTASYIPFEGKQQVTLDGTTRTEPNGIKDLLLLPQDFAGNNQAVVKVTYTMKTGASAEIAATEEFKLNSPESIQKWEPNKRYTYNILFGTGEGGLQKIYFAPVVEDWEDVENIELPL